jgi:hypothetical protein
MEVDQEANEFGELYNANKLNQPIKTITVSISTTETFRTSGSLFHPS